MIKREKIEQLMNNADKYIDDHPEILKQSIHELFEKMNDGSLDMLQLRWGVMARQVVNQIDDFDMYYLVEKLDEYNNMPLLCEYVGFLLQEEKAICLIELLLEASKRSAIKSINPYVITNIPYEKELNLEYNDVVLDIISKELEEFEKEQFIWQYAKLIVNKNYESEIIDRYIYAPTETFEKLVNYIAREMFYTGEKEYRNIMDRLAQGKNNYCNNSFIDFINVSVKYDNETFDLYIERIEALIIKEENLLSRIIPAFVEYLENCEEGNFRGKVYVWLDKAVSKSLDNKLVFSNMMMLRSCKSKECREVMILLFDQSFEKNERVLNNIDMFLKDMIEENLGEGLEILEKIFKKNEYNSTDSYFDSLPYSSKELANDKNYIIEYAFKKIIFGDERELYFGLQLLVCFFDLETMRNYLEKNCLSDENMMTVLGGIVLFTIEPKLACELVFEFYPYAKDKEKYYVQCEEKIYGNYAGTLIKKAERYKESKNILQQELACKLLDLHKECTEALNESYKIKDLWPSQKRISIYEKAVFEMQKEIKSDAESKSVLFGLIQTRKMKFGKRYALVQENSEKELDYQVQEYLINQYEFELPKFFIDNPLQQSFEIRSFLEGRKKHEISD